MQDPAEALSSKVTRADRLNRACACVTLDLKSLRQALDVEAGEVGFGQSLLEAQPHFFSHVPVSVLAWAPALARHDFGPAGALMGYDFHLTPSGPRLIEVNTNAGGAFLNAVLARAQRACCGEAVAFPPDAPVSFEETACQMFQKEWLRQRGRLAC